MLTVANSLGGKIHLKAFGLHVHTLAVSDRFLPRGGADQCLLMFKCMFQIWWLSFETDFVVRIFTIEVDVSNIYYWLPCSNFPTSWKNFMIAMSLESYQQKIYIFVQLFGRKSLCDLWFLGVMLMTWGKWPRIFFFKLEYHHNLVWV